MSFIIQGAYLQSIVARITKDSTSTQISSTSSQNFLDYLQPKSSQQDGGINATAAC